MASFRFLVLLLVSLTATAHGCIDCNKQRPSFGTKCCDPHYYEIPTEKLSDVYKPLVEKPPVYKPSVEKSNEYKPLVDNHPAYKIPLESPFYKSSIKKPPVYKPLTKATNL
ncbi:putative repetitive proline-rich cell wall protein [Medicago truncatula]|uniref:Repetitive proline-rich cell wall protein n=1 Tax=Medicago truncatula TaxID=3880 RepID=A0A072UTM8_MEDTR|nr:repetitive proline-rich cell wall protein 2 [Medicago truncatula]KEH29240.1 repetitive proline-rich cell wall protein [Medicago truncatula]RHN59461.1 putative repetitive proline-rich cell wall protein [Medicago truncatula]